MPYDITGLAGSQLIGFARNQQKKRLPVARLHDVPLRFSRTAHGYHWEVGIPTSSASPRGHWGGRKSAAGTQQVLPLFLVYIAGCLDQVYK